MLGSLGGVRTSRRLRSHEWQQSAHIASNDGRVYAEQHARTMVGRPGAVSEQRLRRLLQGRGARLYRQIRRSKRFDLSV